MCGFWHSFDAGGHGDDDYDGVCFSEDEGEEDGDGCGIWGDERTGTDMVGVFAAEISGFWYKPNAMWCACA